MFKKLYTYITFSDIRVACVWLANNKISYVGKRKKKVTKDFDRKDWQDVIYDYLALYKSVKIQILNKAL